VRIPGRPRREPAAGLMRIAQGFLTRHEMSVRGAWRARVWLEALAEGMPGLRRAAGLEDFDHPSTWDLLSLTRGEPSIVHLHNLHGDYFDLRYLPTLSRQVPCVVSMHDAWLLSGHCAHSLDCDRWLRGCGKCPYLTLPIGAVSAQSMPTRVSTWRHPADGSWSASSARCSSTAVPSVASFRTAST
jgi:hypothetical protein